LFLRGSRLSSRNYRNGDQLDPVSPMVLLHPSKTRRPCPLRNLNAPPQKAVVKQNIDVPFIYIYIFFNFKGRNVRVNRRTTYYEHTAFPLWGAYLETLYHLTGKITPGPKE
jgi:hypothetical protein